MSTGPLMAPSARNPRRRHVKALALLAAAVALAALAAPALGAFGLLRSFGPTGSGSGQVGPHAPALAVSADGHVYVADRSDGRIEAFTNAGAASGGWGGLDDPSGVAAAPDGTLVVSDEDGVYRFDADGTLLETLTGVDDPRGVAVGPDGGVYVAQADRVVRLGGTVFGGLHEPGGVAVAPDGSVYVADRGDGRVHVFSAAGAELRSWAAGDARSVALAPDGDVLVADTGDHEVLRFAADGTPEGSFGRGASPSKLNVPKGVATDCRGSVYVVDNSALRVHVYGESDAGPPPCKAPEPPPAATPEPTAPPAIEVAGVVEEEPLLGVRGRATPIDGTVLVAGEDGELRPLDKRELLPVGSTVDATNGRVLLEFEAAPEDRGQYGRLMSGEFYEGAFTVDQGKGASVVTLSLLDEGSPQERSFHATRKGLKVWGKARGRFRTRGRNGAATVRGTQWVTEERSGGTHFAVTEGVVAVRDFAKKRTIILRAGESYLARPACVSRRSFRIRLRVPPGATVRKATVRVDGEKVAVRRGRRVTAPIDLRGKPAGRVVVRIRIRTADGRTVTGKRVYRTCAPKRTVVKPPAL